MSPFLRILPIVLLDSRNGVSSGRFPSPIGVGTVTTKQLLEIAETKKKDLNSRTDEAAIKIIAGTARSMGIDVVD